MTKRIQPINPIYHHPGALNIDIHGVVTASIWIGRTPKEIHAPLSEYDGEPGGVLALLDEMGILPGKYTRATRVTIIQNDPTEFYYAVIRPHETKIIQVIVTRRPQWVQEPQPTPWEVLAYYG